jgi:demethylmenaquinone methyltransferase/2-methoxy-6-polyprenyl-1,4-benzoquinol methylase
MTPVDEALRAKEPDQIAVMFDAVAPRYDLLNRVLSAGFDQGWRRRAVDALRLRSSDVLLDICTGTADIIVEALGRKTRPRCAIGIDFASEMLRQARPKLRRHRVAETVLLARADATKLPLGSGTVDAAVIAFGIRNVQRPDLACSELSRVLRPGGRLAVLEFGLPRSRGFRTVYLWYAQRLLPVIGRLVSHHRNAYAYLPESVSRFPPPETFGQILQASGFSHVSVVPLTLGIVYLYVAQK